MNLVIIEIELLINEGDAVVGDVYAVWYLYILSMGFGW